MRIGWYGSGEKFVLLLIHLESEDRPRRRICFGIKSIAFEVRKSRFVIILFLFYKSINQSLVLNSYNLCKIWNVNPLSVLKISFISLIHYICNVLTYIYMWILYLTQLGSLLIPIYFLPFSTLWKLCLQPGMPYLSKSCHHSYIIYL